MFNTEDEFCITLLDTYLAIPQLDASTFGFDENGPVGWTSTARDTHFWAYRPWIFASAFAFGTAATSSPTLFTGTFRLKTNEALVRTLII